MCLTFLFDENEKKNIQLDFRCLNLYLFDQKSLFLFLKVYIFIVLVYDIQYILKIFLVHQLHRALGSP